MVAVVRGERFGDLVDPLVELACRPRVKRGEAADDAGCALGNDQSGLETMNKGAPITGRRRCDRIGGQGHGHA